MSNRTPDEILSAFDQAQAMIDQADDEYGDGTHSLVLRDLLWEVLDDVVLCARQTVAMGYDPEGFGANVVTSITDLLINNFGMD